MTSWPGGMLPTLSANDTANALAIMAVAADSDLSSKRLGELIVERRAAETVLTEARALNEQIERRAAELKTREQDLAERQAAFEADAAKLAADRNRFIQVLDEISARRAAA